MSKVTHCKNGRTGYENATGHTSDISEDMAHDFYDPVMYITNPRAEPKDRLGRWLGPSRRVGGVLCSWVLTNTGMVVSTSSIQAIYEEERKSDDFGLRLQEFDTELKDIIDDERHMLPASAENDFFFKDIEDDDDDLLPIGEDHVKDEADEYTPDAFDTYIGAQLLIPHDGERVPAKVPKSIRDNDGKPIGVANTNPNMGTRKIEVELPDGSTQEYYANLIAENIFAQVDSEGRRYILLKEILDHKSTSGVITKEDGYYTTSSGNKQPKRTARG